MDSSSASTATSTVPDSSSTGRSVMGWGGAIGAVIVLLSLMGRDPLGVVAGLAIAGGAMVAGSRMQERDDATRHRRALELLLHDPNVLMNQANATRDLDIERLRGMMKKQHIELTEARAARADLVRLSQSLTALQLAAWEKSDKDPSFRALFDQISGAVQTTQDGVDSLLRDLSGGSDDLPPDAQQRFEAVSEMLLTVLDRWINRR